MIQDVATAKNVSRGIAIAMLFLGRASHWPLCRLRQLADRFLTMAGLGTALVVAINALGGLKRAPSLLGALRDRHADVRIGRRRRQRPAPPRRPKSRRGEFALDRVSDERAAAARNYTSRFGAADRGRCTSRRATTTNRSAPRSAYVGWTYLRGDALTWEVTPLLAARLGHDGGDVAGGGGQRRLAEARLLHRGPVRARRHDQHDQLLLRWSGAWAFARSSRFASASAAHTHARLWAPSATSSAGRRGS
jgi:hypothetical protein